MKRTEDFFIPENKVKLEEELDYSRVGEYIRSAEAFSRSTYQSVYIIDYFKQYFLYVSPNHGKGIFGILILHHEIKKKTEYETNFDYFISHKFFG